MHRNNAQTSGKAKNFKGSLAKLGPYLKPYLFWIILAIFFSIVGSFSSLFGPKLLGEITKSCQTAVELEQNIDFDYITKIGISLIVIYVFSALSAYLASFFLTGVTQRISYRLRKDISIKINKVPLNISTVPFTAICFRG